MDDLSLLIDLHLEAARQGPGDATQTRRAIELAGLSGLRDLRVAHIGCGTGASSLVLAQDLRSRVAAVDTLPAFLAALQSRAEQADRAERITPVNASMDRLLFEVESQDAIWSEGAIYNMGFENDVSQWCRHLKPGGVLAVSELTWLTASRPIELEDHWRAQYPEVGAASSKLDVLERHDYAPIGYFVLPEHCWLDAYYRPMQQRFAALTCPPPAFGLARRHGNLAFRRRRQQHLAGRTAEQRRQRPGFWP